MPPAPISSISVKRSPKRWPGAMRSALMGGPGDGELGTGWVEASAASSAKVEALQDGQRPPAGTSAPQWGQLTGARLLAARRTSRTSLGETEGDYHAFPRRRPYVR